MLKRTLSVSFWLIVVWSFVSSALPNEIEYTISAQLDIAKNIIIGSEVVRFTNRTGTTLTELYFHVVPNAFKRSANTKYQQELQRAGIPPTTIYAFSDDDAFMEIKSITANGQALAFTIDDTLMRVVLKDPLADGQTLTLQIEFINDLMQPAPQALWAATLAVRSGHRNSTYTVALWYPKVVVYDADEGWNLDQYSYIGEFYGDFANYDVTLTVPANFVVGCTGVILNETVQGTQKIVKVRAERVRDFAWVAGPFYRVEETKLSTGALLRVLSLGLSMTAVSVDAVHFFSERFGPYAYPMITVAQVTVGGGMEYPGIIMIAGGSTEEIVHELAHQWWYGAVGNDEMDEAWLDEAFATFSEELYKIERQKAPISSRSSYRFREPGIPVLTRADRFPSWRSYGQAVYIKGSGVLWMLRWVIGAANFDRLLREYYARFTYKNATTQDFVAVAEEVSAQELDWFFDIWLRTAKTLDFSLPTGSWRRTEDGQFETKLTILRQGEALAPVRVVLYLCDGSTMETRWDGQQATAELLFKSKSAPAQAEVDPDRDVLEENRANNSLSLPASSALDMLFDRPIHCSYDRLAGELCAGRTPRGWPATSCASRAMRLLQNAIAGAAAR
ncbi:MAG: M1 family aminopeptidase [Candidatus Bipolaricaulota bacterium]|nr:M1 family aminopeptidase [Candidatus Bipolaricaulota bacterium]MDW8031464.1 M1 family aminopeptidase [Candidatus Bipolaricaulota bacterium]